MPSSKEYPPREDLIEFSIDDTFIDLENEEEGKCSGSCGKCSGNCGGEKCSNCGGSGKCKG